MELVTWLKFGVIGLPLIGALIIWRWGDKRRETQRWLASGILGLGGLAALALFFLNRQYACTWAVGRQNCLFEGLATLSLILLNLALARAGVAGARANKKEDYVLMLLLSSAWAGVGLAENVLALLLFLNLFLYVVHRWLKKKGLTWRFLTLRDDYKDDKQ